MTIDDECRKAIMNIFNDYDIRVEDNDNDENLDYFITNLNDVIDNCFYDYSIPFQTIFQKLSCVPIGFQVNNEYYGKSDFTTYYGIRFVKLQELLIDSR